MKAVRKTKRFRQFWTSGHFLVICGKSAEQNEELVKGYLSKQDIVLHTAKPGSPFCVIKVKRRQKPSAPDIDEAAQFCACFSQQWKARARQAEVHAFRPEQVIKEKRQPTGTFTVLGKVWRGKVKLELWLGKQKGRLRALPKSCLKQPLLRLRPGRIPKDKAAAAIAQKLKALRLKARTATITKAIPAGGFSL